MGEVEFFAGMEADEVDSFLEVANLLGLNFNVVVKLPKAVKIIRTHLKCRFCGVDVIQYIKMAQYSNGLWQNEQELTVAMLEELKDLHIEDSVLTFPFCCICRDVYKMVNAWKKEEYKEYE
jgi:hypothetical protein